MEIQNVKAALETSIVQEEAAIQSQAMNSVRDAARDLEQRTDSSQAITDPYKGNYLNLFM